QVVARSCPAAPSSACCGGRTLRKSGFINVCVPSGLAGPVDDVVDRRGDFAHAVPSLDHPSTPSAGTARGPPMTVVAGSRLGPYEIEARIGAGGMGEVYRARDTRLDRTVAVKVLAAQLSERPDLRERFDREARAISALNHPCICALYDVGHQDGI